jgi:hypothetical protein
LTSPQSLPVMILGEQKWGGAPRDSLPADVLYATLVIHLSWRDQRHSLSRMVQYRWGGILMFGSGTGIVTRILTPSDEPVNQFRNQPLHSH